MIKKENLYNKKIDVAYFSMEIMLETDIPTYAGGLGILAGDLLRTCADMRRPAIGVSLVYSGNQFQQVINPDGSQIFKKTEWQKLDQLNKLDESILLDVYGKKLKVNIWRYDIVGFEGFLVPVFLLDTDFINNEDWGRDITKNLYGGSGATRILQELVLGVGGVRFLRKLGFNDIKTFHLNEGHTAFAVLELLKENNYDLNIVKSKTVFSTHTPVPEGHDRFDYQFAYDNIGSYLPWNIKELATSDNLSMSDLALNCSKKSFAVSKKHFFVASSMFPNNKIDYVTNGVHPRTWISSALQDVYNEYLPGWINDPSKFKQAESKIPNDALEVAHKISKKELIDYVNSRLTSVSNQEEKNNPLPEQLFDLETLTISIARRPVSYKRPLLLYTDIERFARIGVGKIQIIQCGKSHPQDDVSKEFVKKIVEISKRLKTLLRVVYLEDYSPKIARLLVGGSDVWLNTPRRPLEASGTSGMKASLNGVINFSILDGWWIEAFEQNPEAGFSIGPLEYTVAYSGETNDLEDADSLYKKLEEEVIPLYYNLKSKWLEKMKKSITLGGYFNTFRCINEYKSKAWDIEG